jgi:hypothetical protein
MNAPTQESGYVGLLEAQQGRRPGLGKLAALDDVANFAHQPGLELFFLRIFEAKVGKYIPAAAVNRLVGFGAHGGRLQPPSMQRYWD